MNKRGEKIEDKFLNVITSLLGHEPSEAEMKKILKPLNELGENARQFIFNILDDINSEADENERIKKMEKFVTALRNLKDETLDNHKPD